ncbi:MAG: hypothetical protein M5U28_13255 [Sandaracinaceae bacterium]|nr:hypothetical protein [Sandaracinaceae bacterium]
MNAVRVMPDGSVVGHYLVTGSDARRDQVVAQGNRLAVNINELNAEWQEGGITRADAMMAWARREFPSGVPRWFFLNEISRSRWLDPGERGVVYRQYVADVARRLSVHHGRTVVVLAPFYRPGWSGREHYAASWRAVARHAYIGVENYISAALIRDSGFSEAYCRNRYQQSITAYTRLGVPLDRLILFEHFGQTTPDKNWGRAEVSIDDWLRAIRVRTRAARSLPFAGYGTYGWGANRAHRPSAERIRAMDAYHRVGARRLALPDHSGLPATMEDTGYAPDVPGEPDPSEEVDPDESDPRRSPRRSRRATSRRRPIRTPTTLPEVASRRTPSTWAGAACRRAVTPEGTSAPPASTERATGSRRSSPTTAPCAATSILRRRRPRPPARR